MVPEPGGAWLRKSRSAVVFGWDTVPTFPVVLFELEEISKSSCPIDQNPSSSAQIGPVKEVRFKFSDPPEVWLQLVVLLSNQCYVIIVNHG